jgi:hypothetical protein
MTLLQTLRQGSSGPLVGLVQTFLRGRDLYHGAVDEDFGPKMLEAVRGFQRTVPLDDDGVVGNDTWGALMQAGLTVLPSEAETTDTTGANWPPAPVGMLPLNAAQRAGIFGAIDVEPAPVPGNPEAVKIVHRAAEYRLLEVEINSLRGVPGFPGTGRIFFHARVARQLQLLVEAWSGAGLLGHVLSWGGSYAPRFVRGSRTVLSPHAWGTAFDVNVAQNALGAQPALGGRRGSVRELVPLANEHGFFWGGHFGRPDGMHFEVARVM